MPDAAPVNVATVLDRSGSMTFFGYVDITRVCTRQFIDLMGVGDHVGLVSFGDDARVEFPAAGIAVEEITGQAVKDTAMTAVTNVAFGGCTAMGDGIASAAALLGAAPSPRAIVLFSDGYDNKGCAPPGSTRPSALQAAQALPADVRLFSCAMGPASDQPLLESLAAATSGRYYFMTAIDELFEIYNYIRGQVSGTSIVVNQAGQASTSAVPAFIDAAARAATFTVAWTDAGLRAVGRDPQKPNEVGVRLVDPRGRTVPEHASFVRRHVADTFVVFRIEDPAPGRWHVQVKTQEQTHVAYTAGVFVDSPLRLVLATYPRRVKVGDVVQIGAVMLDGTTPFDPGRASMAISAPTPRPPRGDPALAARPEGHRTAGAGRRHAARRRGATGGLEHPPEEGRGLCAGFDRRPSGARPLSVGQGASPPPLDGHDRSERTHARRQLPAQPAGQLQPHRDRQRRHAVGDAIRPHRPARRGGAMSRARTSWIFWG